MLLKNGVVQATLVIMLSFGFRALGVLTKSEMLVGLSRGLKEPEPSF